MKTAQFHWGIADDDDDSVIRDWCEEHLPADGVDLIIGADLAYDPDIVPSLTAAVAAVLRFSRRRQVRFLLATTIRIGSTWARFLDECTRHDLRVAALEALSPGVDGLVGTERWDGEGDVRLVEITLDPLTPLQAT